MRLALGFRRRQAEHVGVVGIARIDRDLRRLAARLQPGDIAVIDQLDLDGQAAAALADRHPAAVVNASPCLSGRFPALGAEILVDAGVILIDDTGPDVLRSIRDGQRICLRDGEIFSVADGERLVARGRSHDADSVRAARAAAADGLAAQLDALVAQSAQLLREHAELFITPAHGINRVMPSPRSDPIAGRIAECDDEFPTHRPVVVGFANTRSAAAVRRELRRLRRGLPRRPVVVVVGEAVDDLRDLAEAADVAIAPDDVPGVRTIVHRRVSVTDPHAGGDALTLDLPIRDVGLLLAAALTTGPVITIGAPGDVVELLDDGEPASAVLTRLRLADRLVSSAAVAAIVKSRRRRTVAAAVIALIAGVGMGLVSAQPTVYHAAVLAGRAVTTAAHAVVHAAGGLLHDLP
ncbi:MAG: hypothetical protein IRZ27_03445 [Acidothermus cellulolyticus]|nr:hypothetical protein [Acidothermus cellulolyticus]